MIAACAHSSSVSYQPMICGNGSQESVRQMMVMAQTIYFFAFGLLGPAGFGGCNVA